MDLTAKPACGLVRLALLLAAVTGAQYVQAEGRIAYIAPSRDNSEIRLIGPDGGSSELVWALPSGTARESGIGALSWSPDGAALAFDSGHEWQRSMALRDIYTLRLKDKRLTRPMNAPSPAAFDSLPKGAVTVDIANGPIGRKLDIYVEGAAKPETLIAKARSSTRITFSGVADFGPGVQQRVRVYDYRVGSVVGEPCWLDVSVTADVEPGKTAHAGALDNVRDGTCAILSAPAWRADGNGLMFLHKEVNQTGTGSTNNIWQADPDAPPGGAGKRLLQNTAWVTNPPRIFFVAASPLAASADDVLMLLVDKADTVWRGDMRDARAARALNLGLSFCIDCKLFGAAWLPDGSGFMFSRYESATAQRAAGGAIYAFTFASGKAREVLRLPGEVIGRLAVEPDGKRIVFERGLRIDPTLQLSHAPLFGPRLLCPCALWIANSDGGDPRLLAPDGRAPAWASVPD